MAKQGRIIVRADGNSQIGLGHVMRSLALSEMLLPDFEVVFAMQVPAPKLQEQVKSLGISIISLPPSADYLSEVAFLTGTIIQATDVVVLDGYNFDTSYQKHIKNSGCGLICLDDLHQIKFVADAVINQAGGVSAGNYECASYTKLYLGPTYSLLRPPFLEAAKEERLFSSDGKSALICLGGADPLNYTQRVSEELFSSYNFCSLKIVVGTAYQRLQELTEWVNNSPGCTLLVNQSASEMVKLMKSCQFAVTSASGIAYEACAVGNILFILQTAENQKGIYHYLLESKLAIDYHSINQLLDQSSVEELFYQLVERQRSIFDGTSPSRLKDIFKIVSLGAKLTMRDADKQDMLLLLDWANDPEVRKRSFNTDIIPLAVHEKWYYGKLGNKISRLYLAEIDEEPAAHIRFDLKGTKAIISYMIGKPFRHKGLGHVVLQKGISRLQEQAPGIKIVEGLVQLDNHASIRAFEKAGFYLVEPAPAHPEALCFHKRLQTVVH